MIVSGVVALLVVAAVETATHSLGDRGTYALIVGLMAVYSVLYLRLAKRLRCPACDKSVLYAVQFIPDVKHCPYCGADWAKPLDGS